ncbi:hypothetical protein K523DRAFT_127181 [Schizophyllum commune Tattone D]|nr:hypothetical protein K523DRAFT_127181 [Schizophyllum commune Tattone D]
MSAYNQSSASTSPYDSSGSQLNLGPAFDPSTFNLNATYASAAQSALPSTNNPGQFRQFARPGRRPPTTAPTRTLATPGRQHINSPQTWTIPAHVQPSPASSAHSASPFPSVASPQGGHSPQTPAVSNHAYMPSNRQLAPHPNQSSSSQVPPVPGLNQLQSSSSDKTAYTRPQQPFREPGSVSSAIEQPAAVQGLVSTVNLAMSPPSTTFSSNSATTGLTSRPSVTTLTLDPKHPATSTPLTFSFPYTTDQEGDYVMDDPAPPPSFNPSSAASSADHSARDIPTEVAPCLPLPSAPSAWTASRSIASSAGIDSPVAPIPTGAAPRGAPPAPASAHVATASASAPAAPAAGADGTATPVSPVPVAQVPKKRGRPKKHPVDEQTPSTSVAKLQAKPSVAAKRAQPSADQITPATFVLMEVVKRRQGQDALRDKLTNGQLELATINGRHEAQVAALNLVLSETRTQLAECQSQLAQLNSAMDECESVLQLYRQDCTARGIVVDEHAPRDDAGHVGYAPLTPEEIECLMGQPEDTAGDPWNAMDMTSSAGDFILNASASGLTASEAQEAANMYGNSERA